jgi:hypothetical protein
VEHAAPEKVHQVQVEAMAFDCEEIAIQNAKPKAALYSSRKFQDPIVGEGENSISWGTYLRLSLWWMNGWKVASRHGRVFPRARDDVKMDEIGDAMMMTYGMAGYGARPSSGSSYVPVYVLLLRPQTLILQMNVGAQIDQVVVIESSNARIAGALGGCKYESVQVVDAD